MYSTLFFGLHWLRRYINHYYYYYIAMKITLRVPIKDVCRWEGSPNYTQCGRPHQNLMHAATQVQSLNAIGRRLFCVRVSLLKAADLERLIQRPLYSVVVQLLAKADGDGHFSRVDKSGDGPKQVSF